MTSNQLRARAAALILRKLELVQSLGDRNLVAIENAPEDCERLVLAAERELAGATLGRRSRLLREMDAALDRIGNGTYGICESCERAINPRRLEAVPWARYCVGCQEVLDKEHGRGPESGPRLPVAA
jgi:DnaK suppressor protein